MVTVLDYRSRLFRFDLGETKLIIGFRGFKRTNLERLGFFSGDWTAATTAECRRKLKKLVDFWNPMVVSGFEMNILMMFIEGQRERQRVGFF